MTLPPPTAVRPAPRSRSRARLWWFAAGAGVLLAAIALSLLFGNRDIPLQTVFDAIFARTPGDTLQNVVLEQRLPRTINGLLAGAALAVSGVLMQGLTRNPVADPGLLGVNAGASLFVLLGISLFGVTTASGFVWFAIVGAAIATAIVVVIGSRGDGATPARLALTGAALTAGFTAIVTLILILDDEALDRFRFWQVGSLLGRGPDVALTLLPFFVVGLVAALFTARALDLAALGDDLAAGLGQRVALTRVLVLAIVVVLCGSATALVGPLLFVGLAMPHIARALFGPGHARLLPAALVGGPAIVLLADVLGRVVAYPQELEVGIVVAFLGGPLLIALVRAPRSTL